MDSNRDTLSNKASNNRATRLNKAILLNRDTLHNKDSSKAILHNKAMVAILNNHIKRWFNKQGCFYKDAINFRRHKLCGMGKKAAKKLASSNDRIRTLVSSYEE